MLLLSRVLSPRAKQEPESALEVIILIELRHEGHYFASFHHSLIKLIFCCSRLSDQKLLLVLKLNIRSHSHPAAAEGAKLSTMRRGWGSTQLVTGV